MQTLSPALATAQFVLVFAEEDTGFVDRLREALETRGIPTFREQETGDPHDTGSHATTQALATAQACLFVLSPASATSERCLSQLGAAEAHGVTIVPIVWQEVDQSLIPVAIADCERVSLRESDDFFAVIDSTLLPQLSAIPQRSGPVARVFVSYSRRDAHFTRSLVHELKARQVEAWVDWEDIPAGMSWRDEIASAIVTADAVVFVISRNSVGSDECGKEIRYAYEQNKRIVTVKIDDVPDREIAIRRDGQSDPAVSDWLQGINYVSVQDGVDRAEALEKVLRSVTTDLRWVRQHTRWLQRAQEWAAKRAEVRTTTETLAVPSFRQNLLRPTQAYREHRHARGCLLRGAVLDEAEDWLKQYANQQPAPTELQRAYVRASRNAEHFAHRLALGTMAGVVVIVVLAAIGIFRLAQVAQADKLGQQALAELQFNPERSIGYAVDAVNREHFLYSGDADAVSALRQSLAQSHLRAILRAHTKLVHGAAFSPDGSSIVSYSGDGTARIWNWRSPLGSHNPIVLRESYYPGSVWSAAFSSDGSEVVTASILTRTKRFNGYNYHGSLDVWNARTGADKWGVWLAQSANSTAINPKTNAVIVGTSDGFVTVWSNESTHLDLGSSLGTIDRVAFSKDGRYALASTDEGGVYVWDWASRNRTPWRLSNSNVSPVFSSEQKVYTAAFNPQGNLVVVSCGDGTARIWNWRERTIVRVLRGHGDSIYSAAFSHDGSSIVTGAFDETARVWDVTTGRMTAELVGHLDSVFSAAFSPDDRSVVTASYDGTARVWNAFSGRTLAVLRGSSTELNTAAFSPDGRYVVTASGESSGHVQDNTVRVWDAGTGQPERSVDGHSLAALATAMSAAVNSVVFSPDGKWLLTTTENGRAEIWNWPQLSGAAPAVVLRVSLHAAVDFAAFSPDGRYVVTAGEDGLARVWNWRRHTLAARPLHAARKRIAEARFSADGRYVVTAGDDGTARVWDWQQPLATQNPVILQAKSSGAVYGAAFSPDGNYVATGTDDSFSRVWAWRDPPASRLRAQEAQRGAISDVAFSPDGRLLGIASGDDTAMLWDWSSNIRSELVGHTGTVESISFSPDGNTVVTSSTDGTARVWDVHSGQQLMRLQLPGSNGGTTYATFSPDAHFIVGTQSDRQIAVYRCDVCGSVSDLLKLARGRQP